MEQKGRKAEGAPGRGAAGAAGRRRVSRAAGAQAEALVPAVGRGGCWSGEQNRRAGGRGLRRRWPPAWCAPPGLPSAQPVAFSSQRALLPSRKLTVWEGPPADTACIHAASAPVTGVARRQEGGGCGSAAAGWRRSPNAGARVTGAPPRSPFGSSFSRLPSLALPQTSRHLSRSERAPDSIPEGREGQPSARRWVGGRTAGRRAGRGREGECRVMGPAGRRRDARPAFPGMGALRRDPRTRRRPPLPGCQRCWARGR